MCWVSKQLGEEPNDKKGDKEAGGMHRVWNY
jgi:hypothetical protein